MYNFKKSTIHVFCGRDNEIELA